jgi:hypothetical protein
MNRKITSRRGGQGKLAAMGYQGNVGKDTPRLLADVDGLRPNISFTAVSQDVENDQGTVELLISFPDICRVIARQMEQGRRNHQESNSGSQIDLAEKGPMMRNSWPRPRS